MEKGGRVFFSKISQDPHIGYDWAVNVLCRIQHHEVGAEVFGFKWKPHLWEHEYNVNAWKEISKARDPTIKVVLLHRNPLDKVMSNLRHQKSMQNGQTGISPHCAAGDMKCVNIHSSFEKNLTLPTGSKLINIIKDDFARHQKMEQRFIDFDINYIKVSYEALYDSCDASEWIKLFKFLGKGKTKGLLKRDIEKVAGLEKTHKIKKADVIANFGAVEETLKGSSFEYILY